MTKVVTSGLAAGFVMNVVDSVANGLLLAGRWQAESSALNPVIMTAAGKSTVFWIVTDFITGVFIVCLYASLRPRLGAGPSTAMTAGIATWAITHLWLFSTVAMNIFSATLIGLVSLAGLVATLLGAYVGGMLYKDANAVAAASAA